MGAALADLHDVGVPRERTLEVGPLRQERLAPPAREREVHAGGGAERLGRRVALLLGEVAVPVHVDEPASAGQTRAIQAPEQHTAIAADHHREAAGLEDALHLLGQREGEGADGAAVADAGAGLGLDLVQGPRQAQDFVGVERLAQPRLHQHARRLPGAGLLAVFRAKAEVGRREHDAHGRHCRRGGARAACAEEDCACDHAELPPGHAHGCCDSSPLTYNQYYIG